MRDVIQCLETLWRIFLSAFERLLRSNMDLHTTSNFLKHNIEWEREGMNHQKEYNQSNIF